MVADRYIPYRTPKEPPDVFRRKLVRREAQAKKALEGRPPNEILLMVRPSGKNGPVIG